MYLLDTNVISELRKNKPHGAVQSWFASVAARDIQIPAVAVGELQDGIELTRLQDPLKAAEIERWIDRIVRTFVVVSMDGDSFRETARLMAGKPDDLFEDAMIAATAQIHKLIVVTRNTKDFTIFGSQVFNPFTYKGKN
ncbi:MAG TPA: type II toxin-antitoxin system VapC family toxin [Terracidiphilus sp.]|jgi:toxin FitB|nr:type II toxin-antitoxin system VapC family toxin [Terracidiphilus sp.]